MLERHGDLHKGGAFAPHRTDICSVLRPLPLINTLFTECISALTTLFRILEQVLADCTGEVLNQLLINHAFQQSIWYVVFRVDVDYRVGRLLQMHQVLSLSHHFNY